VNDTLSRLFDEVLKPVHPEAQDNVPVPEGLDLDQPFNSDECQIMQDNSENDAEGMVVSFVKVFVPMSVFVLFLSLFLSLSSLCLCLCVCVFVCVCVCVFV
jgi:hypothetical protein